MHHQDRQRGKQLNAVVAVGYAVERVIGQAGKAQLLADKLTVDRVGGRSQRARAERHFIHALVAVLQAGDVALEHIGVCHHIVGKRGRLRTLQMGVARHDRIQIFAALFDQRLHECADHGDDLLDLLFHIHTHIKRNLIVARAAGVQTLARVADALGQQLLDVHVDVLVVERELHLAVFDVFQNILQALDDLFRLVLFNDALLAQHGRVRDRTGDIFLI